VVEEEEANKSRQIHEDTEADGHRQKKTQADTYTDNQTHGDRYIQRHRR